MKLLPRHWRNRTKSQAEQVRDHAAQNAIRLNGRGERTSHARALSGIAGTRPRKRAT